MWETQFWSLGYEDPLEKEWLQTWQSDFERRKRHTLFVVPGVSLNFSKNGSLYWLCSTLLVIFVLRTSPWHLSTPWAHHACSVESNSWPHGLLHAKLLCSWDSQAKILEWVATYSSKRSSQPGIEPTSPASIALTGGFFTTVPGKPILWCLKSSNTLFLQLICRWLIQRLC